MLLYFSNTCSLNFTECKLNRAYPFSHILYKEQDIIWNVKFIHLFAFFLLLHILTILKNLMHSWLGSNYLYFSLCFQKFFLRKKIQIKFKIAVWVCVNLIHLPYTRFNQYSRFGVCGGVLLPHILDLSIQLFVNSVTLNMHSSTCYLFKINIYFYYYFFG